MERAGKCQTHYGAENITLSTYLPLFAFIPEEAGDHAEENVFLVPAQTFSAPRLCLLSIDWQGGVWGDICLKEKRP